MKHQIYFLICPVSKQVCYVGVSVDAERRYQQHLADKSDCSKAKWIQALLEVGQKPTLVVVNEVDEEVSKAEESRWIAFGLSVGWPLRNDSLPNPEHITWPYTLPEYKIPSMTYYTVCKYEIPAEIRTTKKMSKISKLIFRTKERDFYPHVMRVWFNTVDEYKFCMFYSRNNDDLTLYEKPLLVALFNHTWELSILRISDTVFPEVIQIKEDWNR